MCVRPSSGKGKCSPDVNKRYFWTLDQNFCWKGKEQAVRKLYLGSVSRLPSTLSKATRAALFNFLDCSRMTQSNGSLSKWPRSEVQGLTSQADHFLAVNNRLTQLTGVSNNCHGAHTVLVMAEDVSGVLKLIHLTHASVARNFTVSGYRPMSAQLGRLSSCRRPLALL